MDRFSGWNITLQLESRWIFTFLISHLTSLGSSLICAMPCLDSAYIAVSIFPFCIPSFSVTLISAGGLNLLLQTRKRSKHSGHLNEKNRGVIASKNSPSTCSVIYLALDLLSSLRLFPIRV